MKNIVLFKKIPRENKMAYLVSMAMGAGMGVLMVVIWNFFLNKGWKQESISTFAIVVPIAIASIILLLILFKWFSIAREDIKVRIKCIILMLISYICLYIYVYGALKILHFGPVSDIIYLPLDIILVLIMSIFGAVVMFLDPDVSLLLTLTYSGIFIVTAAYLATKGIINLRKRIILSFLVGFFIYIATIIPLILAYLPTFS